MIEEDPRPAHELEADEPTPAVPEHGDHGRTERRRRPVADWGGDDLFNHVPRRRFARAGATGHTRRPSASPITSHQLRRNADADVVGLRTTDGRGVSDSSAAGTLSAVHGGLISDYEPETAAQPAARILPSDSVSWRERPRTRRPVDERVGPRPDRIAALAFILGMLLVLLAVATADAAVLASF